MKKIYKYMTSISKTIYIDKLDDIVNKYNSNYHITIKMNLVDFKDSTYLDHSIESNAKEPKFKADDTVIISKYKNIALHIGLKFLLLKKIKILNHGLTLIGILMVKTLLERFTKKNCKRQIKRSLELKK